MRGDEQWGPDVPLEKRRPVGEVPVPKHEHEWVEAYRYLPFQPEDLDLDTDEPPKNELREPLVRHEPDQHGEFDPELHYRVGQPGPEIVETCSVCTETRVRPVKGAAYRGFLKQMRDGKLEPEQVSLLPLELLLGDEWEKAA